MTDLVRDAYDANAELYATLFRHELDQDQLSIAALATFAKQATDQSGPVIDLGCGPGSTVHHLASLGLAASGIDVSPGQIAQARAAFPDEHFAVGDLTALECNDASLGGIVSRYSIIHLPPPDLPGVFTEWFRALEPRAPLFVSFFGSRSAPAHGTRFDHKVTTAYELFATTIEEHLGEAGFVGIETSAQPIPEGGRPFDHTIILAQRPAPGNAP